MSSIQITENILKLAAGIGVYLIAFKIISRNLEAASSEGLKNLFAKVSESRLIGILIGTVATILIQSSSAVTVMTIGFVNTGIMSLKQAAAVIFGAEIGTTITGQIVALGLFDSEMIELNAVFSSFALLGIVVGSIGKTENSKRIGDVISGFGILFIGLSMMSGSMSSFAQLDIIKTFLASINSHIILIVAGALITAIIHSSAAMTSIAITMVSSSLISLEQGIYITLGANVGTCFTGMMAAMSTTGANSKRVSLIQLIFNGAGALGALIVDMIIKSITSHSLSLGIIFERLFAAPHLQLAMFHTIFNIVSVLAVIPLRDKLVELSARLIPDEPEDQQGEKLFFVDENMMATPVVAVSQVRKEIVKMAEIAMENFNMSIDFISNQHTNGIEKFRQNERQLNYANQKLVDYVTRLSTVKNISRKDHQYLSSTYRAIADFERIGDYSENIVEYAENLIQFKYTFSEEAKSEISTLSEMINKLYEATMETYENGTRISFLKAMKIEEEIDKQTKIMADNHIRRLNKGLCSADAGAQFLSLASDIERIGDHLINTIDRDYELSH